MRRKIRVSMRVDTVVDHVPDDGHVTPIGEGIFEVELAEGFLTESTDAYEGAACIFLRNLKNEIEFVSGPDEEKGILQRYVEEAARSLAGKEG